MSRAFGFSIYRKAKYVFDGWIETATGHSPLQHVNKPGTYPTLSTVTCFTGAGMVSGAICAFTLSKLLAPKHQVMQLADLCSYSSCGID